MGSSWTAAHNSSKGIRNITANTEDRQVIVTSLCPDDKIKKIELDTQ